MFNNNRNVAILALLISASSAIKVQSDPICSSSGCEKTKLKPKNDWPKDYPVPNLGMDPDIIGTFNSLAAAEGIVDHHWDFTFAKEPVNPSARTMYNFAPELEPEMIHSANHLAAAEDTLN